MVVVPVASAKVVVHFIMGNVATVLLVLGQVITSVQQRQLNMQHLIVLLVVVRFGYIAEAKMVAEVHVST